MILVDTSVWVDFFRGTDSRECLVLQQLILEEANISIADIILTEVLQGIVVDKEFQRVKDFLLEFPIDQTRSIETYLRAADIYRACRRDGKTIHKTIDCLIAAVCIENNRILLHKDIDFDRIANSSNLQIMKLKPS